ncbi:ribulose-5-phosphate 4-epimerase-like epimerase or aldolase [Desulfocapsa sulfexigens DSM 10523]|uniref:Ribulose-5-phosphate 4-epimerase-like epimerase or aldolase n=1 Tax=Desulfocapsa sulfexigens (strain DSM 10523 / SB164P1) TaxID=1167006 RepID=M1P8I8_DESSD|nr:class II aldolase/adducin family protein [Desulfocapsa sulfexigens]AGF77967.1 ribulose-5-phosphate 4-epimerase-like epimerase or aldolase [Desulfocapsa sulfexigens DSM 10523]
MEKLLKKYALKLIAAGLAENPLICGLDDEVVWSRADDDIQVLEQVLAGMNINSLICIEPADPYLTIFRFLCDRYPETITPEDCETRTFLHDVPVISNFSAAAILTHLRRRKSIVVASGKSIRLITFGAVSPEQAFVSLSSVCFSAFVLFFTDYLADRRQGVVTEEQQRAFDRVTAQLSPPHRTTPALEAGPFRSAEQVHRAIIEAGRFTVDYGLVDSYFGNISYRLDQTIYISQTGSSLDELAGCIDPCPLDDSSCAGITASSELVAHEEIYRNTANRAILHGHPKFAVILSMDCSDFDCINRGRCHIKCSKERLIEDIPIVPGEVGTGPTGLCHTLPPAIQGRRGVIVWGHGLFTVATVDFNEAFKQLLEIENMCREEYFARVRHC